MSLLVPADVSFCLLWPIQTKPSTWTFSYHWHSPRKITCPYKQTFTFLSYLGQIVHKDIYIFYRHLPHRLTFHHRRFLAFVTAYTGQPVHMDIFFSLTQPKQAFSSTQTLSSFFRGLYRPTRPHGHFLASPMAHTGQLVHTYVFFPPLQPAQAYLTTQTLSFYYHSLHWLTPPNRPSLLFKQSTRDSSVAVSFPESNARK